MGREWRGNLQQDKDVGTKRQGRSLAAVEEKDDHDRRDPKSIRISNPRHLLETCSKSGRVESRPCRVLGRTTTCSSPRRVRVGSSELKLAMHPTDQSIDGRRTFQCNCIKIGRVARRISRRRGREGEKTKRTGRQTKLGKTSPIMG